MKILLVTNFYKPSWESGGETRSVFELATALVGAGHEVTVITTDFYRVNHGVPVNVPTIVDGVTVYYIDNMKRRWPGLPLPPVPLMAINIIPSLISNFDIVHINGHRNLLELLVYRSAKVNKIPYLVHSHGSARRHGKVMAKIIFDKLIGNKILQDASSIIISTKQEISDYESISALVVDYKVAPNFIDISEFYELPQKNRLKKRLNIDNNKKIILFVGRINRIKGLETILKSFSIARKQNKDLILVIVGPSDDERYRKKLDQLVDELSISDSILFTGPLYSSDKVESYVDADLFIMASRYECYPNTVFEALLSGTPVVSTETCPLSDIIEGCGVIVSSNEEQIAKAITDLIEDETRISRYGTNGRKKVLDNFDRDKIVDIYLNIYKDVIYKYKIINP